MNPTIKPAGKNDGFELAVKYGIIAVIVAGPVLAAAKYLEILTRYIRNIAWNSVEALPPVLILALVTSPIWNKKVRTAFLNWIDIASMGVAKAAVRSNPLGWYENRVKELGELITEIEALIEQFRAMIGRLTGELKSNKDRIGKVADLTEVAGEHQESMEEVLGDFDINAENLDLDRLDQFEETLQARNDKLMAETEAVSLADRNRELGDLIRDFVGIWKFLVELRADMKLVHRQMGFEMKTLRDKWETSKSIFRLLTKAHKFSRDAVKNMLTDYAKQYVNESYDMAIAQFKNFRTQGSDLIREAALNRRAASRKAKDILAQYRQMKAVKSATTPDQILAATQQITAAQQRVRQ